MNPTYTIKEKDDQIILLHIRDLLGEYANREILRAAEAKIDKGFHNFVVDLQEVTFMNSVGLNCLISIWKRLKAVDGQLVVANCSRKVRQLLDMTKLNDVFVLAPSVDAGINALFKNV